MFDYDEDEEYYYFVLEKMEGDLQQMLEEYEHGMPSNIIKKIFSQINSGLKIMFDNGMCHRDLNPQNILYSYTNKEKTDFIIKICDFGLTTDLGNTTQFDKTNAGTPNYKAPEVETGEYNNKCDLYSIGIILYMLKTREYIFEGKTLREMYKNQEKNKFKKETDDKLLNDLIKKLVVYERKDRINWDDYFNHPFFIG
jgi:calcium-dependent protein kinase